MEPILNTRPIPGSSNLLSAGVCDLVRGAEADLLDRVLPLVRRQSLCLDLSRVERIDAAGVAALIALYRAAREAGRCFGVTNPTAHVREILVLVGLDRFLMNENAGEDGCREPAMAQSAA